MQAKFALYPCTSKQSESFFKPRLEGLPLLFCNYLAAQQRESAVQELSDISTLDGGIPSFASLRFQTRLIRCNFLYRELHKAHARTTAFLLNFLEVEMISVVHARSIALHLADWRSRRFKESDRLEGVMNKDLSYMHASYLTEMQEQP